MPRDLVGQVMQSLSRRAGAKTNYDYEQSELLKYENRLMREAGDDLASALAHLEEHAAAICDRIEVMEARARLLLKLGRAAEAETAVMALLRRNPHNATYYRWMEAAVQVAGTDRRALYTQLSDQLPPNDTLLLQSLSAVAAAGDSEAFRAEIAAYLDAKLANGPATGLFNGIKFLHDACADNAAIIGEVVVVFAEKQNGAGSLGCLHFLAQHYDRLKNYPLGLDCIDQALRLQPDLVELHLVKAKLLKHAGQLEQAIEALAAAHALDPEDRCVGSKYARYLLKAGQIEPAVCVMRKYTKVNFVQLSILKIKQ